ncbi:MAG: CBS domain-containing protein, partial [Snowella sp.]
LTLNASQVMQTQVESLVSDLTLAEVLPLMSRSHHRGFPVVEGGKLVGVFTQTDLANAAQRPGQTLLRDIMTAKPITVNPDAPLSDVLYLLNRYKLSRLPVIRGTKLVGIITRTDIIREEATQLGGGLTVKPSLSYIAYQTRAPSTGEGRILLPLSNPQTAPALFQIAAAIAKDKHYEIDCLQVLSVPKHRPPSEIPIPTQDNRKILQRMERLGRHLDLSVHTQIKFAHNIADTILETIRERQIDILVMGWKGTTSSKEAIFGSVVDILIDKAPCNIILVKLGKSSTAYPKGLHQKATWLIPMAGGPNIQRSLEFL